MEMQLTLAQRQILSQRMIQSAEILQMNRQELETYLEQQALENPLIELEHPHEEAEQPEDSYLHQRELHRKLEWLSSTDRQNRVYYNADFRDAEESDRWNFAAEDGEQLADYVYAQLIPWIETDEDRKIFYELTQSLDSRGYCTDTAEELAERYRISEERAEEYLACLRRMEPAGVGASGLSMCLMLQLERMENAPVKARQLVLECLELLGKNQLTKIAARLEISMEETVELCELVRSLNPKPGSGFASRETLRYVYPEIAVVKFRDYFEVVLNDNGTSRIRISSTYRDMLKEDLAADARDYIQTKIRQAEWISQCIEQRSNTLMSVMGVLVEMQEEFFRLGPGHRRPLRLQDVAERLEIHESTVSRAVRDKYLQCHWGVYPLNYFFAKAFGHENSREETTTESVQDAMKRLIAEEDPKHPLSDQKISDRLKERGVQISRRTVAKYRAELGIRDASGRKKF